MENYSRAVYYYETDKMGVVHHSNYTKWLEEAREAFFSKQGLGATQLESKGILAPVTELNMKYIHYAKFGDSFNVQIAIKKNTGARIYIDYIISNQNGTTLMTANSVQAFVNLNFKPTPQKELRHLS